MGTTTDKQQMPGADRDEEGVYTETYDEGDFLEAVEEGDLPGTQDVADAVGCSYQNAYKKLNDLADEGKVESRKVGGSLAWFVPDKG